MKPREFWIIFGSSINGEPYPEAKVYLEDPKIMDGFGGITVHVREVLDDREPSFEATKPQDDA